MALLNLDQQTAQALAWQAHATTLATYQAQRSGDPNFDALKCQKWIDDALNVSNSFALTAITADFADAADAGARLNNVVTQSGIFVDELKSKVNTWNRIASTGDAIISLIGGLLGPLTGTAILGLATTVAQKYTGNPNADSTAQAPPAG